MSITPQGSLLVYARMGKVMGSDELQLPRLQRVSKYNLKLLKTVSSCLGLSLKVLENGEQCGTCSGKYSLLCLEQPMLIFH